MWRIISLSLLVFLLAPTILASRSAAQPPPHAWSGAFGGTGDDGGYAVAVDGAGNVYVTGDIYGIVDLGGGTLPSAGNGDIFLAKYGPAGNHLWSHSFGGASYERGRDVAVGPSGNVFVTGYFVDTVNLGGAPITSKGDMDIFIAKYDGDGNHLWSSGYGSGGRDMAISLAVDGEGNVLVTGYHSRAIDLGGGLLDYHGSTDIFIAKYDPLGNHLWSRGMGGVSQDTGSGVAVDAAGNVFATGKYAGPVDLGGGPLTSVRFDAFVVKYDPAGNHVWSRGFGGEDIASGHNVVVDNAGDIFVSGMFTETAEFGGDLFVSNGGVDIFFAKYDGITGDHLWSRAVGGTGSDQDLDSAVDAAGNFYVTGYFQSRVDFGGGEIRSATSAFDVFMAKYDATLNHVWSRGYGGYHQDRGWGIAIDDYENIFLTGNCGSGVDFGGGVLPNAGSQDIFLVKFGTVAPPVVKVPLDIRPASCPNPLNITPFENPPRDAKLKKGGILPVAILGCESLDVGDIDPATLRLEGIEPLRYDYVDVAAPLADGTECECTEAGPDGYTDLTLKFSKAELAATLGAVSADDVIPLTITGELWNGTAIEGTDCVWIRYKVLEPPTPLLTGEGGILGPPVPNPFNPVTRISYVLPREEFVTLAIYDVSGRIVERLVEQVQPAGEHVVEWHARGMASGIYFCRIEVGDLVQVRKMLLMK